MQKGISKELLEKYLSGKCSEEEEAIIDAWYASLADRYGRPAPLFPDNVEEKLLEKVKTRIAGSQRRGPLHVTKPRPARRAMLLAAASVAVVLVAAWWAVLRQDTAEEQAAEIIADTGVENTGAIKNTGAAIRRVALEDGTVVWLKPGSHIVCPDKFSARERKLTLSGEAFFEVARDTLRPFSIVTSQVVTQVLGTSFNIKAYEAAHSIEVEVLTGKVAVRLAENDESGTDQAVLLVPSEKATYFKSGNRLSKDLVQNTPALAMWQGADISFDNEPVRDVLKTLNARFQVKILVKDAALLNCQVRADFNDQNLPDILEMLSKSIDASYEIKGDVFYLTGEGCPE